MLNLKALKEAAEKAVAGPWSYRPNQYDDWGILRAADGSLVAVSRGEAKDYSPWRDDPYAPNGRFIALANPSTILSLIERCEQMQKALGIFGSWAIDVSTLRTLEQLETAMNEAGVSLQQVGEWVALSKADATS